MEPEGQLGTEPKDIKLALAQHQPAQSVWTRIPPSHRREYLKWVAEAKRPETRARRISQVIERLASTPQK